MRVPVAPHSHQRVSAIFFWVCVLFRAILTVRGSSQARGKSELQLRAYATATATGNPSHVCNLHSSLQQPWIPDPPEWGQGSNLNPHGSSRHGVAETNPTRNHEISASLSGLRILRCHELWCRSQMRLRSGFAVAVMWAGSWNSKSPASLETSICLGCGTKK